MFEVSYLCWEFFHPELCYIPTSQPSFLCFAPWTETGTVSMDPKFSSCQLRKTVDNLLKIPGSRLRCLFNNERQYVSPITGPWVIAPFDRICGKRKAFWIFFLIFCSRLHNILTSIRSWLLWTQSECLQHPHGRNYLKIHLWICKINNMLIWGD